MRVSAASSSRACGSCWPSRPRWTSSERRLAGLAFADRLQQLVLEGLKAPVDEVLLGGEVVEHRLLGDLRGPRDLRHGDALEAALAEEAPGGLGDELARLLLLALPQPRRRRWDRAHGAKV
jgi:hypothetical protein